MKCSCNQRSVTSKKTKIFELNTYECIIAIYLVKKNPTANFFELGDFNVSICHRLVVNFPSHHQHQVARLPKWS